MPNVLLSNVSTTWTNSGTAYNAIKMNVTDTASAAASKLIDLQTGGASRFNVDKTGNTTVASAAGVYWSARGVITSPADGILRLTNNALTDFSRLQFGGTTSAFPSLKRNGTVLQARLADDSGDAGFSAANVTTSVSTANTATIAASGYSVLGTDATPMIDLSGTWNTTGSPTALKLNVVNTASGASANIMDLQVDGTSKFKVAKSGFITFSGHRIYSDADAICLTNSSNMTSFISRSDFSLIPTAAYFGWGNLNSFNSDLTLYRDNAADTLALRRTTNAQTFRVYNTYTDGSNYERATIGWTGNVLQIGTANAGTGLARALELQTNGTTRVTINGTTGAVTFASSGTFNSAVIAFQLFVNSDRYVGFSNRSMLASSADGLLRLVDSNDTNFNRLQFGGTTASFPSLKRSSTSLQVRLADDSGDGDFQSGSYRLGANGIITETSTARTLSTTDNGKMIYFTNTSAVTVTTANTLGAGFSCGLIQANTGQITITAGTDTTVNSFAGLTKTVGQYAMASIFSPVANNFILAGNLA